MKMNIFERLNVWSSDPCSQVILIVGFIHTGVRWKNMSEAIFLLRSAKHLKIIFIIKHILTAIEMLQAGFELRFYTFCME